MNHENRLAEPGHAFRRRSDIEKKDPTGSAEEHELRTALETAGLGTMDYYPLTGEIYWSNAAKAHFGLSPDAQVNYNVFLVGIHPEDRARVEGIVHRSLDGANDGRFSTEYRTVGIEDGKERLIEISGQAFFNQWGEGARLIATTRDVTESVGALRESEETFETLFNSVYDGILLHETDGTIVDMNEKILSLYRVEREQLRKLTIEDISAASNPLQDLPRIWEAVMSGEEQLFEWKAKRPADGSVFDVEVFLRKIHISGRDLILATVRDITDRQKSVDALRNSEQRLRATFDNAALGIVEVDQHDRVVAVNERLCRMLGYAQNELLGMSVHELTAPEDRPTSDRLNAQLHEGSADKIDYEKRYLKRDGSPFWVRVTVSSVRDESGRHVRSIGTIEDIHERKRMEEALRDSEERYRLLFDKSPLPKWVFDLETLRIREVNDAALEHYGYSREEFLGLTLGDVRTPDEFEKLQHWAETCCAEGRKFEGEVQTKHRKKNGEVMDVDLRYREIAYEGRRAGLGIVIDITERRRAEAALKESEEKFRTMADNIAQFAWMADGNGWIFWYNKRWYEYTGTTPEEMEGWGWQKVHHPDHVQRVVAKISQSFKTGEVWQDTFPLRSRDGTYRWFLSRAVPIRDEQGTLVRWFGTNTDITELREAEEKLKQTVSELQRSNSELQQFAYVASHDLQEPLRTVGSYVELLALKYKGKLDQPADKYIAFVVEGAHRMSQLINDLLAYSRVGTRQVQFESVDMMSVFRNVLRILERAIQDSGASVIADDLPVVTGDPSQLLQLVQNLIANAIKFLKPDRRPEIHLSAERQGTEWVFAVRDNGIGIEPRFYDRIFVIFQRLHTREEYAGTGIGLAICRRILELHGGRIWVESKPGEGSTFYFSLPV